MVWDGSLLRTDAHITAVPAVRETGGMPTSNPNQYVFQIYHEVLVKAAQLQLRHCCSCQITSVNLPLSRRSSRPGASLPFRSGSLRSRSRYRSLPLPALERSPRTSTYPGANRFGGEGGALTVTVRRGALLWRLAKSCKQ